MSTSIQTFGIVLVACVATLYWTVQNLPAEINGEWFQSLQKPDWFPSNRLFGPVWTVLYLILAYVAYRLYEAGDMNDGVILAQNSIGQTFVAQLALNIAWAPVFFMLQEPGFALLVILVLDYFVYKLMVQFAVQGQSEFMLLIPYAGWLAFSTALNASIVWLN